MAILRKKKETFTGNTVQLEDVALRYDDGPEILSDVSLTIPQRSFHFLTGPSGAGKTSLMSLMYLARRPSRGALKLFGNDVTTLGRNKAAGFRRRLGVIFQDFRLLDHLSAFDNVALPLRIAGVAENVVSQNVTELLTWVGLEEFMEALPPTLSGGQQQRVAIARAVINKPELILADEPTGNVDDAIAVRLMQLFIEMHKLGSSIIIATHNESLVERFSFPRLHIERGKVEALSGGVSPPSPSQASGG